MSNIDPAFNNQDQDFDESSVGILYKLRDRHISNLVPEKFRDQFIGEYGEPSTAILIGDQTTNSSYSIQKIAKTNHILEKWYQGDILVMRYLNKDEIVVNFEFQDKSVTSKPPVLTLKRLPRQSFPTVVFTEGPFISPEALEECIENGLIPARFSQHRLLES